jgi:hypothetical protein
MPDGTPDLAEGFFLTPTDAGGVELAAGTP